MEITKEDIGSNQVYLIYHQNCLDGSFAMALMESYLKDIGCINVQPIAAQYGNKFDLPKNGVVVFVDFSVKKDEMLTLIRENELVYVFDHHIEAKRELDGLSEEYPNFRFIFDNEVCGTQVVYNSLPRTFKESFKINNKLINHITDFDLFKFKIPGSEELRSHLEAKGVKKDSKEALNFIAATDDELDAAINEGRLIKEYVWDSAQRIADKIIKNPGTTNLGGYEFIVYNTTTLISELGKLIGEQAEKMTIGYFILETLNVVCSLRSNDKLHDVSKIASFFGGGGHRNAAGFTIPINKLEVLLRGGLSNISRAKAKLSLPILPTDDSSVELNGLVYLISGDESSEILWYVLNGEIYPGESLVKYQSELIIDFDSEEYLKDF